MKQPLLLDYLVIVLVALVMLASACVMPFMPAHESGDPIGVAAFAAVGGLVYGVLRSC